MRDHKRARIQIDGSALHIMRFATSSPAPMTCMNPEAPEVKANGALELIDDAPTWATEGPLVQIGGFLARAAENRCLRLLRSSGRWRRMHVALEVSRHQLWVACNVAGTQASFSTMVVLRTQRLGEWRHPETAYQLSRRLQPWVPTLALSIDTSAQ